MDCGICGERMKTWKEEHEAWGKPVFEQFAECVNPNCGEEDEEEEE